MASWLAPVLPEVIVVGGSAGALDALSILLADLPDDFAVPIVIVVHLPRRKRSALSEVLAAKLGRPVREPLDKEPVSASMIYVAPPDYHLLIDRGMTFALSVDEPVNFSLPSIDVLFESAARSLGGGAIGILLSGANADGAYGLKVIEDAGGLAFVQAPADAAMPAMPNAAIALCERAAVLPAAEIRAYLIRLAGRGGESGRKRYHDR
ncbi:CheB methylesterase [Methylocaldum marinum]|uniref:protein-glutamate methylesterase n=1 Tax=Methylocaldum marinum TaxID=1432792 RepID=A0A250KX79_9GAMM|nr:chemotaxis protein CheB [Methylocaldum marinum]BBA36227.1 CheB methylesterase [Methylocaldum marinum]